MVCIIIKQQTLKIFYKDINNLLKIAKKALIISFINDNVDYKDNYLSYKNLLKP